MGDHRFATVVIAVHKLNFPHAQGVRLLRTATDDEGADEVTTGGVVSGDQAARRGDRLAVERGTAGVAEGLMAARQILVAAQEHAIASFLPAAGALLPEVR